MRDKLLDVRMNDGSRHFAEVPSVPPLLLRDRVARLPGAAVTEFLSSVTETWIDFTYRGNRFTAHNPLNDFWLFVEDPACPDDVLLEVVAHLRALR